MKPSLVLAAGRRAFDRLQAQGPVPALVHSLLAASGGPKGLMLVQLDHYLAGEFLPHCPQPVDLLGTSVGAWRMACHAQARPLEALERFQHFYTSQQYSPRPSREEITTEVGRILAGILGSTGAAEIAANARVRLHVIAARARGGAASDDKARLLTALGLLAAGNLVTPAAPRLWFERVMFRQREGAFPWHAGLPLAATPDFTADNVFPALMATGSIPLVVNGIRDIPGAPAGTYRDGGLTDYHLTVPLAEREGIVLYPHFSPRVVPGWFDKALRWRRPDATHFDDVLLVTPSRDFIAGLPHGRIPDRQDFVNLGPDERLRYWRQVHEATRRLADDFHDLVSSDRWRAVLRPLAFGAGGDIVH